MDDKKKKSTLSLGIKFGPGHHSLCEESKRRIGDKQPFDFSLLGEPRQEDIRVKMLVFKYSGADKAKGTNEQHKIRARLQEVASVAYTPEELKEMGLVPGREWELRYATHNNQGTAKLAS